MQHDARPARRAAQLLAQPLVAGAVVEQPGQPVALDLLAQRLALARGVVRERGHRREALDELDLLVGERRVRAVAVARSARRARARGPAAARTRTPRARPACPRRRSHSGSSHDVRHVARPRGCATTQPVTPVPSGIGFAEHLVDPVADREHRPQQPPPPRRSRRPSGRRSAAARADGARSARACPRASPPRGSPRPPPPALRAQNHDPSRGSRGPTRSIRSVDRALDLDAYTARPRRSSSAGQSNRLVSGRSSVRIRPPASGSVSE